MSSPKIVPGVFAYLLIDIISFSLILPWFPTIMEFFSSSNDVLCQNFRSVFKTVSELLNAENNTKGDVVVLGGLISSLSSLVQFFSSPFIGAMSDYYGRKPILLVLQLISIASYFLAAFTDYSFAWFLVSRILCAITRANIAILTAAIGDSSDAHSRTRGMIAVGAAYSFGFTLGPLMSAIFLGQIFNRTRPEQIITFLGLSAAVLNMSGLFVLHWRIPETVISQTCSVPSAREFLVRAASFANPKTLFSFYGLGVRKKDDVQLRRLGLIWFLYLLIFSGLEYTLVFLAQSRFEYTSRDQGRMFFLLGAIMALVQGILIRRFRLGNEIKMSTLAVISLALSAVIVGLARSVWVFYIGLSLFALASAVFVPSMHGAVSLIACADHQGHVLGVYRSLNSMARAIGPATVSFLFWILGPTMCNTISASFLIVIASVLMTMNTQSAL